MVPYGEMRMKRFLASLILFATTLGLASSASAVVITGTTYTFYLAGEISGNPLAANTVFDNVAASTTRGNLLVTLSESDTALDAASNRITLNLSANGDLFPVFNEGAFLGIGTFGDVLDLETDVTLYDVRVTLSNQTGVVFASDNLVGDAVNSAPWDGSFPSPGTIFLVSEVGGMGVSNITFDFFVTTQPQGDVPEPGSVLLCGVGLLAVVAVRRYRRTRV
jgi:hypothetical protein